MNVLILIWRSVRFHARTHLGTLLGAMIGSAILTGALIVGDSIRSTLREMAFTRLGEIEFALSGNDRFVREQLASELGSVLNAASAAVLQLPATATTHAGANRANRVQVLGIDNTFRELAPAASAQGDESLSINEGNVALNTSLAEHLKAGIGDTVLLRIHKPSLLSREAPIAPQENFTAAARLKVQAIVGDDHLGRFSLQANQVPPLNAFVSIGWLQQQVELPGKANLLLVGKDAAGDPVNALRSHWRLADAELAFRELPATAESELHSARIFLDAPISRAVQDAFPEARPVLTYFVNELRVHERTTPYSMVTAAGAPLVPQAMRDDEVLINQWLAEDLQANPGDELRLAYFVLGTDSRLVERTNVFRVHGVVPLAGTYADRELMPEFPGLAEAESSHDWDAGFPIDMKRIRDKDEQYWKDHRGTPKAFVTLRAGQEMWANRFGNLTAIRFSAGTVAAPEIKSTLRRTLDPAAIGLRFESVREQALAASAQGQDFGQLFLGFSFFLIAAALLLMGLLFQFGIEQRASEVGTLLALGFQARQVRRLLMAEGLVVAFAGGLLGLLGAVLYSKTMLQALMTVWRDAVADTALQLHVTSATLAIGLAASVATAAAVIWLGLRKQAARPAGELLARQDSVPVSGRTSRRFAGSAALLSGAIALALVAWMLVTARTSSAELFFAAGTLLLVSGLAWVAMLLKRLTRSRAAAALSLTGMGVRSTTRRRKRSLATVALLACGSFLIVAVSAFKLDSEQDDEKSGTGGFAFLGETSLPVVQTLNEDAGLEFFGLDRGQLSNVRFVQFRLREGDDASCLNLNRAQKPRLIGVNPDDLRGRFTFSKVNADPGPGDPWLALRPSQTEASAGTPDEVPAIGDAASIQWALGKKVGDTIDYIDERGNLFRIRIVGAVANSILQGSLVIDEAEFVKRFPGESGYRMFLIDAPSENRNELSARLSRAMQDVGLELTPAPRRLAAFNAVQNTYLSTFQLLGGLGLLLGSAGLGVVVLRNVLERRGELAALMAFGFRKGSLATLLVSEHVALLGLGLVIGIVSAIAAVLPSLLAPGMEIPFGFLGSLLAGIFVTGLLWVWIATRVALRGDLLKRLRNE